MSGHVLVTGASGYLGRALARRLCAQLASGAIRSLTLLDQHAGDDDDDLRAMLPQPVRDKLHIVVGDLRDPPVLERALAHEPDPVFHLAGITSRQAEDAFALGLAVNVDGAMALPSRHGTA
jgi:nucleoside-diphosphate-sugar epimerase